MDLHRDVVQFMHPGAEHGGPVGIKAWNSGAHRRKFLRLNGKYIEAIGAVPRSDELVFWSEWEPESHVERVVNAVGGGPRWIHRPFYVRPVSYRGLQNTDPFVFGDCFFYTLC